MQAVGDHAARGGLVLGICNGFQILCEAGLLPGVLMRNAQRRFICKMQHLRVENAQRRSPRRYAPGQVVKFAIAHGEGNFVADDETFARARGATAASRSAIATPTGTGRRRRPIPMAPLIAIAGVFNERFNVLGLDAASGEPDRSAGRRHRRARVVRCPCGLKPAWSGRQALDRRALRRNNPQASAKNFSL